MGYVYGIIWFVLAVLLFFKFRGEGKIIYVLSIYFMIMGIWWTANEIVSVDLMGGMYVWIFRAITFLMLLVLLVVYYRERHSYSSSDTTETTDISENTSEN